MRQGGRIHGCPETLLYRTHRNDQSFAPLPDLLYFGRNIFFALHPGV